MKKVFKKVMSGLVIASMVMTMTACGTKEVSEDVSTEEVVNEVVEEVADETVNEEATEEATEEAYKIGVIQYVSHPSLDNCYEGIAKAFEESGMNYEIERQIGSDNAPDSDCATFAASMVSQNVDVIFAIATPAASAAFAATEGTDIPVIFCAVSDPVAVELVDSLENPGDLCTGTSDVLDLNAQVDLIQAFLPEVASIGVIYTTSEANSISQLAVLKAIAEERNLEVNAVGIQNDADIPAAASALSKEVDCLINFTDNKVVNNLSVVLEATNEAGIPVFGSEVEQVKNGCVASVSMDYVALGKITGNMGIDALKGADVTTMAVQTMSEGTPVINKEVLDALQIAIPDAYADAEVVETNK